MDEETNEEPEVISRETISEERILNAKKVLDLAMAELETEALTEGVLHDSRYPEVKKKLKSAILEKAEISEEAFDAVAEQQKYQGIKSEVRKAERTLSEARELTKREKQAEENTKMQEKEKENLYQQLKKNPKLIEGLTDEEVRQRATDLSDEVSRVYGEPTSRFLWGKRKRGQYLKELLANEDDELADALKKRQEKEIEKREEEEEEKRYVESGEKARDDANFERIKAEVFGAGGIAGWFRNLKKK